MMHRTKSTDLVIGTRDSPLALWQANTVKEKLTNAGVPSTIQFIKSQGDIDLKTPLYAMGVEGVFTKTLDIALLHGRIDIAVHSLKDVPTALASGTIQAAVLKRANPFDVFIPHPRFGDDTKLEDIFEEENTTIATGSIRRRLQWKAKYPKHHCSDIRGNIQTRLSKLEESQWTGILMAGAAVERLSLNNLKSISLPWMLPAPGQGAVMVSCRADFPRQEMLNSILNHEDSSLCTSIERMFLARLMGGCSTPISAYSSIVGDTVFFKGNILSPDTLRIISTFNSFPKIDIYSGIDKAVKDIMNNGGAEIITTLKKVEKN